MSKYYTPDLEEFHVGFRFEHEAGGVPNTPWDNEKDDGSWIKSTIKRVGSRDEGLHTSYPKDSLAEIEGLDDVYVRNTFRVKSLDREDIEELGWKYQSDVEYRYSDEWQLIRNREGDRLLIQWKSGDCSFRGGVKNYNELSRIMAQLGIV